MLTLKDFSNRPPLTHLKRLTTKDGLIQHADHEVPDPSFGYSIDDNARALIACLWHHQLFGDDAILRLVDIYFSYIKRVEKEGGTFHNFLSFTEQILDAEGSDDSIGRAIWSLGEIVKNATDETMKETAQTMMKRASLSRHMEHHYIRTKAYILLGLAAADCTDELIPWADALVSSYNANNDADWHWFEDSLRYANGILPYAMAQAFQKTNNPEYLAIAEESCLWLDKQSHLNDVPAPIGQNGWYFRGGQKSEYDQQPLEAADMVLAAVALYETTKKENYLTLALEWMNWYYGNNTHGQALLNAPTGGIFDAVTPTGLNANQGAESIVTFLLAYLALTRIANADA